MPVASGVNTASHHIKTSNPSVFLVFCQSMNGNVSNEVTGGRRHIENNTIENEASLLKRRHASKPTMMTHLFEPCEVSVLVNAFYQSAKKITTRSAGAMEADAVAYARRPLFKLPKLAALKRPDIHILPADPGSRFVARRQVLQEPKRISGLPASRSPASGCKERGSISC